jgi:tetratricopeptide (TPR) repeat protein
MFHRDLLWSQKLLQGYMWSGNFDPPADMQLLNEAVQSTKTGEDIKRTQRILEQAVEIDPYSSVRMMLGAFYARQGDDDKALACYDRYRSIDPSVIRNYADIIRILAKRQDYEAINRLLTDGINHFRRRVELYQPHPDPNVANEEFNVKALRIHRMSQEGLKRLKDIQTQLETSR